MVESKKALPKEPRLAYYNHFYGTPMGGGHFGGHFSPGMVTVPTPLFLYPIALNVSSNRDIYFFLLFFKKNMAKV